MNQFSIDGLEPDITIYLDIESKKGIERIKKFRQNEINRLDVEELSFHEKVRKSYLGLSNKYPKRIKLIDAGQPFEVVLDEAQKEIMDNLAH
ncbi:hypothetical protein LOOC260_102510 [Paucilactobacillus hokkaidonensis JCM 18461]|uniref:Thymidylate kinase-like domain-containing protein n=2 Tax=Paucilactobacillus hokkaidonensis TaxID=1193095 RepID=A0A0A1GUW1_9LACO|nr:hypothetical protein IV59_GL001148 [Paucilactobacillus hokkaidonensis]BAP84829.1 hypothetical protein LOOC260_102510 [Paucilactobacillus hokkaidonensis JCM 18461]